MSDHPPPSPHAAGGIVFMHPADAPAFVPFRSARIVLGRDPAAGIPLDGRAVSWQHAELVSEGPGLIIRDLDSTNGVQVDGQTVNEAALMPASLVRLGDFLGVVVTAPLPAAPSEKLASAVTDAAKAAGKPYSLGPIFGWAIEGIGQLHRGRAARVLVEGETGAGKTVVARIVHARVHPDGPFRAIDCATWRVQTDEATAFAQLFEECLRGTVYLGNLPALSPTAQIRLVAAIRDGQANRVSIVAGSQEPFAASVASGALLPALVEAIGVLSLRVPPLRERVTDIPMLFRHLIDGIAPAGKRRPTLSAELLERLCVYDWPCNVREIELLAQRLLALHGDEPRLRVGHLPPRLMPPDREDTTLPVAPVAGVDLGALLNAVRDAGGNIGGAAIRLGITRERAYRLIDRLGIVRGSA